ncbi:MAG TPA: choice-of-anchor D domain-containing protein [Candidatus Acidoferrum sp.]|nr:choice-of-anchor D domain-containing protein [Candidatus Acidoferrum sp.]
MELLCAFRAFARKRGGRGATRGGNPALPCIMISAFVCAFVVPRAQAQSSSQERVYGAASSTTTTAVLPAYSKDSSSGALSLLPGAPFPDRLEGGLVAIDGQGKFLFVLNPVSDNIAMFQIDGSTGALSEVPNSPFAAGPTVNPNLAPSLPVSIAAEKSGNFLYVGYANGDSTTTSALVPFAIDAAKLRLTLTPQLSLDFGNGAPVQMQADAKGLHLYVGLGPGGSQGNTSAGTMVFAIDAATGILTQTGNAGGGSDRGRSIAVDPQGRFFFDAWGQSEGFLDSGLISPADGTSNVSSTLDLGAGVFASVLLVDSSGKFLYAQTGSGLLIYSIDGTGGGLTLLNGPLAQFSFSNGKVAADPAGPLLYSLGHSGVDVFQIDAQSGNLTEITGAPFATGASGETGSLGLAIAGTAIQSVTGPAAQIFPATMDAGQVTVGHTSTTKMVSVTNTGGQTLAISGVTLTGGDAGDFAQSNTCGVPLAPNASCSVSILFTPSQARVEQTTLQVSDNAPGSPQTAAISGTGVAGQGSVTLTPASVNFGTIAQGATVSRTVMITNSGTGVLHISNIAVSGSNPGDFSLSGNCVAAALAIQAGCTVTVNFAPQSEGQRTASLVVTDDGSSSPQSLALSGSGAAPFQLSAAAGTLSATVAAGQTAQYALQITPGPSFTGSVSVSCSGAPSAAACSANPGSVSITGSSATGFAVTVTTTASGMGLPSAPRQRIRAWPVLLIWALAAGLLWLWAKRTRVFQGDLARGLALAILICTAIAAAAGCGGGSAASTPTPQVHQGTPLGTTTLTVTAQSGSLPAQTLQLTLTVN